MMQAMPAFATHLHSHGMLREKAASQGAQLRSQTSTQDD